jgi:hypothetical protein
MKSVAAAIALVGTIAWTAGASAQMGALKRVKDKVADKTMDKTSEKIDGTADAKKSEKKAEKKSAGKSDKNAFQKAESDIGHWARKNKIWGTPRPGD